MIRFASAGSGSRGNATIVEAGAVRILVDCGFKAKELSARLAVHEVDARSIDAVLITHEHSDHAGGVASVAKRLGLRVLATAGTAHALGVAAIETFSAHEPFVLGGLEVTPVAVPHDAREPVQFVFAAGGVRLGVLTDLGHVSRHVQQSFADLDGLLIECNHDLDALWRGSYPARLKRRVAGPHGHLNNEQAARLLQRCDASRLQRVVVAHISEQNNTPELAMQAVLDISGLPADRFTVADQDTGFGWQTLAG